MLTTDPTTPVVVPANRVSAAWHAEITLRRMGATVQRVVTQSGGATFNTGMAHGPERPAIIAHRAYGPGL